jgi:hypothetical protein
VRNSPPLPLQAGQPQVARACLDAFFSARGGHGSDQHTIRAHFASGVLVSRLSTGAKGDQLVAGVLEAVACVMRGIEAAASNPR